MAILAIGEELIKYNPALFEEVKGFCPSELVEVDSIDIRGIKLFKIDHPEFAKDEFCFCRFNQTNGNIHAVGLTNNFDIRRRSEHISG